MWCGEDLSGEVLCDVCGCVVCFVECDEFDVFVWL